LKPGSSHSLSKSPDELYRVWIASRRLTLVLSTVRLTTSSSSLLKNLNINIIFSLVMTKIPSSPPTSEDMSPKSKSLSENKVMKQRSHLHFADAVTSSSSPPPSPTSFHHHHDSVNGEEITELLTKLKDLVPNMPRNKKLSKLEIIQYVIDYIFDLEATLESHPAVAAHAMSNGFLTSGMPTPSSCSSLLNQQQQSCGHHQSARQPLSTLSSTTPTPTTAGLDYK